MRTLDLPGSTNHGRRFATASVIPIAEDTPPQSRYARLAQRSLRRAAAAGATVEAGASADAFWSVYIAAAHRRPAVYTERLIRRLVESRIAHVHGVRLGDQVIASLLTVVTGSHWMCWLAGQTAEGRSIAASYLAYDAVLREAREAGVSAVNLGASVGGGAEFKSHLGAEEVGMYEWRRESVPARATRVALAGAAGGMSHLRMPRIRET